MVYSPGNNVARAIVNIIQMAFTATVWYKIFAGVYFCGLAGKTAKIAKVEPAKILCHTVSEDEIAELFTKSGRKKCKNTQMINT